MYTSLCPYLCVLPVLHRADVVDILIFVGVNTILKNMPYAKGTIDFNHFLVFIMCMSIHVAFRNRFEYRSNIYHPDQNSNLFLNAYVYVFIIFFFSSIKHGRDKRFFEHCRSRSQLFRIHIVFHSDCKYTRMLRLEILQVT